MTKLLYFIYILIILAFYQEYRRAHFHLFFNTFYSLERHFYEWKVICIYLLRICFRSMSLCVCMCVCLYLCVNVCMYLQKTFNRILICHVVWYSNWLNQSNAAGQDPRKEWLLYDSWLHPMVSIRFCRIVGCRVHYHGHYSKIHFDLVW